MRLAGRDAVRTWGQEEAVASVDVGNGIGNFILGAGLFDLYECRIDRLFGDAVVDCAPGISFLAQFESDQSEVPETAGDIDQFREGERQSEEVQEGEQGEGDEGDCFDRRRNNGRDT